MKIKPSDSPLFNCGKKAYLAKKLSNKKKNVIVSTKELRNVPYYFDKDDKVFYESKTTHQRFNKKPANYSPRKYRMFNNPSMRRKIVLRKFNSLLKDIKTPSYLYSVSERDYVKNAKKHLGNSNYILIDISSFFPNCNYRRIKTWLMAKSGLGCAEDVASSLMYLVTIPSKSKYREVPQGYPTSTLICYFAYKTMFDEIYQLASKYKITFTTYVDDLTFSYPDSIKIDEEKFCNDVRSIVMKHGHCINEKKLKVYHCTCPPEDKKIQPIITGVYLKRYKIRASYKMHGKMIKIYNKLKMHTIVDADSYIYEWNMFLSLQGIVQTINLIEPNKTKENRKEIISYLKKRKEDFPYETNIRKIKKLKYEECIYEAYKKGLLRNFIKDHKEQLFD